MEKVSLSIDIMDSIDKFDKIRKRLKSGYNGIRNFTKHTNQFGDALKSGVDSVKNVSQKVNDLKDEIKGGVDNVKKTYEQINKVKDTAKDTYQYVRSIPSKVNEAKETLLKDNPWIHAMPSFGVGLGGGVAINYGARSLLNRNLERELSSLKRELASKGSVGNFLMKGESLLQQKRIDEIERALANRGSKSFISGTLSGALGAIGGGYSSGKNILYKGGVGAGILAGNSLPNMLNTINSRKYRVALGNLKNKRNIMAKAYARMTGI